MASPATLPVRLPIDDVLPALRDALRTRAEAVLQAPPGAGKTTRVPLALLDAPWLEGRKVVMLEPRRLAARAAARRMADLIGERVGETVGYRVRLDTVVGPRTRIEVVTEGVLTRLLQADPALEDVGLVIFDEFHERSLQADLGLALTLESHEALRPDLRLLVMSATLDGARVAALLGDAPVVTSEGRQYPVEIRYADRPVEGRVEGAVAAAVRTALAEEAGDVLVFLPGAGEIRRTQALLEEGGLAPDVRLAPLYGNLSQREQDAAIAPAPDGTRKVVLSTPIAETSLTIEGVRAVVDSGLVRVPRFSPRTGMTSLDTVPVARASADQRAGRAGRLGPGICYRLWTPFDHMHRADFAAPEIVEADLAPLALELAVWGIRAPSDLAWLDPPPAAAYSQARDLLVHLGALDPEGTVTAHGRAMAGLALHPRLAHMLLVGRDLGHGGVACDLAALLSERDVFKGRGEAADADLRLRLQALRDVRRGRPTAYARGHVVDRGAIARVRQEADHLRRGLGVAGEGGDIEAAGLLLAFAYPERIGQRREGAEGRFRLRTGGNVVFARPQLLSDADFLVAAHVDAGGRSQRIFLAAPVDEAALEAHFGDHITDEEVVAWDASAGVVRARQRRALGAVVLRDAPLADPDPAAVVAALLEGVREVGLGGLGWTKHAARLRDRIAFLHHQDDTFPDVSDAALLADLESWLGPHLYGLKRLDEVQRLDLGPKLEGMLDWSQRSALDERAPTHLVVPSGSRIALDYSDPDAPVLAVRLQELFGLTETPRIDGGRVPLTLHLLSPAHRPVQVTQDLASFWRDTYFEVRKDLRGRYPKHYWPEDPLAATPTHRAKPRRR